MCGDHADHTVTQINNLITLTALIERRRASNKLCSLNERVTTHALHYSSTLYCWKDCKFKYCHYYCWLSPLTMTSVFWAAQSQRLDTVGPPATHRRQDQSENAVGLPAFFGWHATSGLPRLCHRWYTSGKPISVQCF